ncbi:MAG: hypothetical protein AAB728_01655, partial [Patescibacteria group bacterium]
LPATLRDDVAEHLRNNPTDSWTIRTALQLDTRVPDSAERWGIIQTLVSAMNALTKKQNTGMRQRAAEHRKEEDWTAWRRDYVGELQEWSGTLKGHVRRKLEKRVETFHTAEEQREQAFLLSLNVPRETLEGKTPRERNDIAERVCLALYGTTLSSALQDLYQRGDAVRQMYESAQSAEPDAFTGRAATLLKMVEDFGKENDRFDVKDEHKRLAELRREQEAAEQWAVRVGARITRDPAAREGVESLFQYITSPDGPWHSAKDVTYVFTQYAGTAGDKNLLVGLRLNYPRCVDATRFNPDLRATVDAELAKNDGNYLGINAGAKRMEARMGELTAQVPTPEQLYDAVHDKPADIVKEIRERVSNVLGDIVPLLDAPICKHLRIPSHLSRRGGAIQEDFERAAGIAARILAGDEPRARLLEEMRREWTHAQVQTDQLEQARKALSGLGDIREEGPEAFPPGKNGFFCFEDERIHIWRGLDGAARERVIAHERGHGILHILRQGVLPSLLLAEMEQALGKDERARREDFDALLERLMPYYLEEELQREFRRMADAQFPSDPSLAAQRLRELRREYALEELFSHYADWVEQGAQPSTTTPEDPLREAKNIEQELFAMLRGTPETAREHPSPLPSSAPRKGRMFTDGDEDASDTGEDVENGGGAPVALQERMGGGGTDSEETSLVKNALAEISTNVKNIDAFYSAYRDTTKPDVLAFMERCGTKVADAHRRLEDYERRFKAQQRLVLPDIDALKNETKDIIQEVQIFDRVFWDISGEKKAEEPGFWDRVRFMSLLDIAKLWKDTIEDFKTIWGRNQQRLLQDVGNVLNDALVRGGGKIPIAGSRYFAKLRGYHDRRYGGAELESVEKWKKAMEKWDTHTVLHRLSVSGNLDEIRGCIELICDRGEMDWNDVDVWSTLEKKSGFRMPKDACLRDDILRDTWLRKMISETWIDKELYYKWRSSNDSNTESRKKQYIQTVDQYSNVSGGLSGNLERQLHLYKDWQARKEERGKVGLPPPPFPDDVKPHLYEEVIEYSIKNGKMFMEDKMYYLVQGVACGLLPIERLRAMAGQHGSIIQFFPQIEYFYGHNNSLPEIKALSKRLREYDGDGRPTYKPGLKTTLWFHFEVARDEQVKRRLSKGSARNAEGYDHEDIPFAVTQMDYNEMSNMLNVISGSRQKVTPEGLKNAYVGFNSKMKIFGNLASLDRDNLDRFTADDARLFAKSLAAYIFMDNTLTRNGKAVTNPPTLSVSQFKTVPPSSPKHTAWDYRRKMTDLIRALNSAHIFDSISWGTTAGGRGALGVVKEEMLTVAEVSAENPNDGYQRNPPGSK